MFTSFKATMHDDNTRTHKTQTQYRPTFYGHGFYLKTFLILHLSFLSLGVIFGEAQAQQTQKSSQEVLAQQGKGPPADINEIPVPKARGFWGTLFFWSGGVLCMYLVGRKVFKEQSHERETLKRFRDELGHFFPEFDPINIRKWVEIASPHLYHGWRESDFSSMESFSSERFTNTQQTLAEELTKDKRKRVCHLDKVIAVHTLGAEWSNTDQIEHPPLGVKLTLRVESKAIDFIEDESETIIIGKAKPNQFQQIWILIHNGKTWTLDEVYSTDQDITHLSQRPPLPPIAEWRRPETLNSQQESNLDLDA